MRPVQPLDPERRHRAPGHAAPLGTAPLQTGSLGIGAFGDPSFSAAPLIRAALACASVTSRLSALLTAGGGGEPRRQVAEVRQQLAPVLGADRLGMKLHPPLRSRAVSDGHQHAVARARDRLEHTGQRLLDAQRVIANCLELAGDPSEQRRALVKHGAQASVHHLGRRLHLATVHPAEPLMAEAHTEQRDLRLLDRRGTHAEVARVVWAPRARGDDDVVEVQLLQLGPWSGVVVDDDRLVPVGLGEQLEEVVGERVVVVDQQRLQTRYFLSTLPVGLVGISSRNSTMRGTL